VGLSHKVIPASSFFKGKTLPLVFLRPPPTR
jgi:hypothetical protein